MRASSKNGREKAELKRRSVARAYIIGPSPENERSDVEVPIYLVNEIYAAVGVGSNDFSQWFDKYGYMSLGRTDEGTLFVSNYPILSKMAWMGIDLIDLSSTETSMLIEECATVRSKSVHAEENAELEALIALAQKTIAEGGTVRFGLAG